tara:strand:- start:82 stop:447 length:366 start_codon:yes stop_codon:yes gene_type:complete
MSDKITNKTIERLTNQLDNFNFGLEQLTDSLNKKDDFTNWSYAEIFGSIANSLIKQNAIANKQQTNDTKDDKMCDKLAGTLKNLRSYSNLKEYREDFPSDYVFMRKNFSTLIDNHFTDLLT